MKATSNNIHPGKILYYVFCVSGGDKASLEAKIIVKSNVNSHNNIKSPWFSCIDQHKDGGSCFDWINEDAHYFLNDCGIMAQGKKPYNLHRLFTSEQSALAYIEECNSGVFSDPLDQEYYDKSLRRIARDI